MKFYFSVCALKLLPNPTNEGLGHKRGEAWLNISTVLYESDNVDNYKLSLSYYNAIYCTGHFRHNSITIYVSKQSFSEEYVIYHFQS